MSRSSLEKYTSTVPMVVGGGGERWHGGSCHYWKTFLKTGSSIARTGLELAVELNEEDDLGVC